MLKKWQFKNIIPDTRLEIVGFSIWKNSIKKWFSLLFILIMFSIELSYANDLNDRCINQQIYIMTVKKETKSNGNLMNWFSSSTDKVFFILCKAMTKNEMYTIFYNLIANTKSRI